MSELLRLFSVPWAMHRDTLEAALELVSARDAADVEGVGAQGRRLEARIAPTSDNERSTYSVTDGVATIPIRGAIVREKSFWGWIFGGETTTDEVSAQLRAALGDASVSSILLDIDSPGGTVSGVPELADQIRAAGARKPVAAFTDGMAASAAYWLASSAGKVYASKAAQVGSIGVYAALTDFSVMFHNAGVRRELIRHGSQKGAGTPGVPVDAEARRQVQELVDAYGEMFDSHVAAARGLDPSRLAHAVGGRVFIGEQAVAAGLIDGVADFDSVRSEMQRRTEGMEGKTISTVAELEAAHSDLVATIRETAKAEALEELAGAEPDSVEALEKAHPKLVATIRETAKAEAPSAPDAAAGLASERARVAAIVAASFEGQSELVAKLIESGATLADAIAQLKADRGRELGRLDTQLGASSDSDASSAVDPTTRDECIAAWERSPALQREFPKEIGGATSFAHVRMAEIERRAPRPR